MSHKELQTIYLPTDLRRRVKAKAAREGTSITAVVHYFLQAWEREEIKAYPEQAKEEQAAQ